MSENKGDLISRKDLRKQINNCEYFHSSFQKMTVAEFLTIVYDLVDNAPTVEAKTVADCIIAYGDGYETARQLYEGLQGKKIQTPSCLTNPERHEELLERYKEGEYGES